MLGFCAKSIFKKTQVDLIISYTVLEVNEHYNLGIYIQLIKHKKQTLLITFSTPFLGKSQAPEEERLVMHAVQCESNLVHICVVYHEQEQLANTTK